MSNLFSQMLFSDNKQYDTYCDAPISSSMDGASSMDDAPSMEKMQADGMYLPVGAAEGGLVIRIDQSTDKAAHSSSSSTSALSNRKARGAPLTVNEAACSNMSSVDDSAPENNVGHAHDLARSSSEPIDTSVKNSVTEPTEEDDGGKKGGGSQSAPSTPSKPMHDDGKSQKIVEEVLEEEEDDGASTEGGGSGTDSGSTDGQGDSYGPANGHESMWKYREDEHSKGWDDHDRGGPDSSSPAVRAKREEEDLDVSPPANVPSGDEAAVIGKALHETLHSESDFAGRCMADLASPMDLDVLCAYLGEVIKLQGGAMRDAVKDIMDHADKTENITKLDMLLYQHRLTGSAFYKTDKGVLKQVTL